MAHEEQRADGAAAASQDGLTRRKVIVTGAAIAAAGVAVGAGGALLVSDHSGPSEVAGSAQPGEPVMVHLKDAQSGQLDLFVGQRRLSFTNRDIAAQLAQASNDAV
jgi:hypothetical protein